MYLSAYKWLYKKKEKFNFLCLWNQKLFSNLFVSENELWKKRQKLFVSFLIDSQSSFYFFYDFVSFPSFSNTSLQRHFSVIEPW